MVTFIGWFCLFFDIFLSLKFNIVISKVFFRIVGIIFPGFCKTNPSRHPFFVFVFVNLLSPSSEINMKYEQTFEEGF